MSQNFLTQGGPTLWFILLAGAVAIAVIIERTLHLHRAQINSVEFLSGVRNVLKRDNVVEAISICDATPGPVARLVKTAILNRDYGRERVREALEEAGSAEVPRLEAQLNILATIAQIAPLLGLLGTVLGFMDIFKTIEANGSTASVSLLSHGIWRALICTGWGFGIAVPCYAAYNFLVSRVNAVVLDMERAATEILNIVIETANGKAK